MPATLRKKQGAYDGVAVTILSEARAARRDDPGFLEDLLNLCADETARIAERATWILKAEVEEGLRLTPDLVEQIVDALGDLQTWQA